MFTKDNIIIWYRDFYKEHIYVTQNISKWILTRVLRGNLQFLQGYFVSQVKIFLQEDTNTVYTTSYMATVKHIYSNNI